MVAVFVVSFEAPVALTAVLNLEVSKTIEEVCVDGVVGITPELFVSERVVLMDSLDGLPVETPKRMFHRQRFSALIVLGVR